MPVSDKAPPGLRSTWTRDGITRFFMASTVHRRDVEVAWIRWRDDAGAYEWCVHLDRLEPLAKGASESRRYAAKAVRRALRRYLPTHGISGGPQAPASIARH